MSKVAEAARLIAQPIINTLGYELVDVEYVSEHKEWYLNIYIDQAGGVSLDDCEKVSRALDEPIDLADITDGKPYVLCVSSPGLDRPLKSAADYARHQGKKVDVKLYRPINGRKALLGALVGHDEGTVTLEVEGENVLLEVKDIALMRLHIEF